MAFNLVNHFRKYQKVWMATVLLLCMITFVLCTGVGGDLSDLLLRWLGTRRGEFLFSVGGRNYYYTEVLNLKKQRNLANDFMLKAIAQCQANINEDKKNFDKVLQDTKADERKRLEAKQNLSLLLRIQEEFLIRTDKKPRYFETGVKLEDLADFIIWRNEADRLGITLVDDTVLQMVSMDLFTNFSKFNLQQMSQVLQEAGRDLHFRPTMATLLEALRQEYRVRLAQLTLVNAQPLSYRFRQAKELERFKWYLPPEVRAPLTPAQLWDKYQQKRAEFDVALVPVHVADFVSKVAAPTPKELTDFFEQYKKNPYDPLSEAPGFQIPQRIKAEWICGDPESPYYKRQATAINKLQSVPVTGPTPLAAGLAGVVSLSASSLGWENYLDNIYGDVRANAFRLADDPQLVTRIACRMASATEGDVVPSLVGRLTDRPTAAMVASLVGGLARPDGFLSGPAGFRALAYQQHRAMVDHWVNVDARARAPLFAGLVASGTPLPALSRFSQVAYVGGLWTMPTLQNRILPLPIIRPEMETIADNRQATLWVRENMAIVRRNLRDSEVQGKPKKMAGEVADMVKYYGLQHGILKEFHDRFTIAQAPALEPLKKAFDKYIDLINHMEGRNTPTRRLKEEDFYKLFFDGGEPFSAARGNYLVRPWPPEVTPPPHPLKGPDQVLQPSTELWDTAEKPFLFWKTHDEPARVTETIEPVKNRVEEAWKLQKAREKLALPAVKAVAKALQDKSGADYHPILKEQEKNLGHAVITLKGLAPWNPFQTAQRERDYGEYTLQKGVIDYPPDDLVKHLLTLPDLTKPFQTNNKDLDALNQQLLEECKKLPTQEGVGKYIQVVANKPRTVYYVACVVRQGAADFREFADEIIRKASVQSQEAGFYDRFLDRTQEEESKEFRNSLLQQLRDEQKRKFTDDKKTRDSFDSETSS